MLVFGSKILRRVMQNSWVPLPSSIHIDTGLYIRVMECVHKCLFSTAEGEEELLPHRAENNTAEIHE